MITVILTVHVLIVLTLIGLVLLQRSEGGALGMGGGGSGGGFMTGRGAANALTRSTSVLAALFFSTSLALAIFADRGEDDAAVIQELTRGGGEAPVTAPSTPGTTTADDLLRSLGAESGTQSRGAGSPAQSEPRPDVQLPDALGAEPAPAESGEETPPAEPQPE